MSGTNQRTAQPLSIPGNALFLQPNGQISQSWLSTIQAIANAINGSGRAPTFTAPLKIDGVAGTDRKLVFTSGGSPRWAIGIDSVAESGGNAGANFIVSRYDDGGAETVVLTVNRQTQQITFGAGSAFVVAGKVAFNNGAPTGPVHVDPTSSQSIAAALVSLGLCKTI